MRHQHHRSGLSRINGFNTDLITDMDSSAPMAQAGPAGAEQTGGDTGWGVVKLDLEIIRLKGDNDSPGPGINHRHRSLESKPSLESPR